MDEINVKAVTWNQSTESLKVSLATDLTPELEAEGEAREVMRTIQRLRKKAGLKVDTAVTVQAPEWPESWRAEIEKKTNSTLKKGETLALVE